MFEVLFEHIVLNVKKNVCPKSLNASTLLPICTHRSGVPVDARGPDERPELVVDDGPVLRVVGLHRHLIELARWHGSLEGSFGLERSTRCTLFAPIFGRTKLSSQEAMAMVRNVDL